MFIAHLPAGYLIARAVLASRPLADAGSVMVATLVGSVLPDADLLAFYLVDERQVHHHDYITHWPLFWLNLATIVLPLVFFVARRWLPACVAFFAAVMSHMVLDTIAAPLKWLMPFDGRSFELVTVPAVYDHWVVNFLLHWTFALELAICAAALAAWTGLLFRTAKRT